MYKTDQAALPYFYGPVAIILLSNLVIFLFTSRVFAKHYDKLKDLSPLDIAHSDFSTSDDWVRLGTVLGQPLSVPERTSSPPRDPQPTQINFSQWLKKYKKLSHMLSPVCNHGSLVGTGSGVLGSGGGHRGSVCVVNLRSYQALQGFVIFAIFVLQ